MRLQTWCAVASRITGGQRLTVKSPLSSLTHGRKPAVADDIVQQLARHLHPHHRANGDQCTLCEAAQEILRLRLEVEVARAERDLWQKAAHHG